MLCFRPNGSTSNYVYDPVRYLDFSRYNIPKNIRFSWGLYSLDQTYIEGMNNVAMYFEEPNIFIQMNIDYNSENFDKKLTLCKYSAELFNKNRKDSKNSIPVFFPVDIDLLKDSGWDNDYDFKDFSKCKKRNVIYTGHIHSNILANLTNIMNKFNDTSLNIPDYFSKMKEYRNSKIAIIHNLLFLNNDHLNIWNKFEEFKGKYLIPQLKSRTFEATASQCIILCLYDEFNVIEDFFEPNVDFLYFKNETELEILIDKILKNYDDYKFLAENAYKKFMNNYTLKHFCDKYLKE
jgi:hypothetical protein